MENKKTTMQDIATKLNISRMTVSKAFKGSSDISAETREKIYEVANELNYNYKTLSSSHVLVLANPLFLELEEQFYTKVYKKLIEESNTFNLEFTLKIVTKEMLKNRSLPIMSNNFDGIILLGELPKSYLKKLTTLNLPMVFLDFYNNAFDYDSIITNNYLYSYEMASYLIQNGHEKISFVGNINSTSSIQDRYLGYYKALLENDIQLNEQLIISDRDDDGLMKTFDLPSNLPTAFLCNNDETAYNLIDFLNKKGYSVPNDLSVVGFDDVRHNAKKLGITTVHVNIEEMARLAIKRILSNIENKSKAHKTFLVNCTMVIRDTVKNI